MKHKRELVLVGKATPDNLQRIKNTNKFDNSMMNMVISSELNVCYNLQCGEPMTLHVFMCRICLKVKDECKGGYDLSIEGVEL